MLRIGICDDDMQYAEWLKSEIVRLAGGGVKVYLYNCGEDILEDADLQHELIILDMEMPFLDGIDVANEIRKENKNAVLVFISGVRTPTPAAFKAAPYRYLLKQFKKEEFEKEITDILKEVRRVFSDDCILCESKGTYLHVKLRDIYYISIIRDGCEVHFEDYREEKSRRWILRKKLKDISNDLEKKDFVYIHNSYMVNLYNIKTFSKKEVTLKDGTVLAVSRARYRAFEDRIFDYWGGKY
jgi:DNA-binding LytR/AlgR family response regulator